MNPKLSEGDLEKIFINYRYKKRRPFLIFFKFLFLFAFVFVIVFSALNFSAIKQQIAFWYRDQFESQDLKLSELTSNAISGEIKPEEILPEFDNNTLYIENINIKAPIIFDVDNNESDVANNLKNGVIQMKNTARPGENGNIFITGHSSNFPWVKSNYNAVFALLDKIVVGDLALIKYQEQNFVYQVTKIYTVVPSNTSILTNDSTDPTLTLMTCVPVGTNLKRLIVELNQILPVASISSEKSNNSTKIPAINR